MNKTEKQAFVRAIMADVPQVDYEAQARKLVEAAVYAAAPPPLKAMLDDPWLLRYLKRCSVYTYCGNVMCYGLADSSFDASKLAGLWELGTGRDAQQDARAELETKLTSTIAGFKTRKQVAAAFPEFIKYLPPEPVKSTNLPALTNIVDQVKAAGWPKGK